MYGLCKFQNLAIFYDDKKSKHITFSVVFFAASLMHVVVLNHVNLVASGHGYLEL